MFSKITGKQMAEKQKLQISDLTKSQMALVVGGVFLILTLLFYIAPLGDAVDWDVFVKASERFLNGESVYRRPGGFGYYNPPWVTFVTIPFTFVSLRLGWSALCAISLIGIFALCQRYHISLFKTTLVCFSPPTFYCLIYGQLDIFVLLGIFLPMPFWLLVATGKPQVSFGMAFRLLNFPRVWLYTILTTLAVGLLSLVFFGLWPLDLAARSTETIGITYSSRNLLVGLWPFQAILGIGLIMYGLDHNDERFFVAASPFLAPYATISSYIGVMIVGISPMKNWQAVVLVVVSWVGVLSRLL
jgi:hypothetical protein